MKVMKFAFIAVALIGILSAFASKKNSSLTLNTKKYGFFQKTTINIGGIDRDVIIVEDVTLETKGTEYNCVSDPALCTFVADDGNLQSGNSQTGFKAYFFASQVDPTLTSPLNSTVVDSDGEFSRD